MKSTIIAFILSAGVQASTVHCQSGDVQLTVVQSSKQEIYISYQSETALADGVVSKDEVDLIAKFPQSGEMTLVAKVGKNSPDNYLFFRGMRSSVTCK